MRPHVRHEALIITKALVLVQQKKMHIFLSVRRGAIIVSCICITKGEFNKAC